MKWTPTCRKQCPTPHEHSDPRKHRADAPGAYHRHAAATSGGIGKYTLCDKVLGAGATARVCKATCTATGIEYAIKILAARPHVVPNEVAAMRRAARHGHPNICSFREHWRQGGKDYMVLEYCSGGELFSALETAGSLPEPEAQHLSRGLVAGVRFMHSRGVAHR
jgi:serine/threonine protein kinase